MFRYRKNRHIERTDDTIGFSGQSLPQRSLVCELLRIEQRYAIVTQSWKREYGSTYSVAEDRPKVHVMHGNRSLGRFDVPSTAAVLLEILLERQQGNPIPISSDDLYLALEFAPERKIFPIAYPEDGRIYEKEEILFPDVPAATHPAQGPDGTSNCTE